MFCVWLINLPKSRENHADIFYETKFQVKSHVEPNISIIILILHLVCILTSGHVIVRMTSSMKPFFHVSKSDKLLHVAELIELEISSLVLVLFLVSELYQGRVILMITSSMKLLFHVYKSDKV